MENRPGGSGFHGKRPRGRGADNGPHKMLCGRDHHRQLQENDERNFQRQGRGTNDNWRNRSENSPKNNGNRNQSNNRSRKNEDTSSRPERTMGFPYVQKLLNTEDLEDVILKLSDDRSGFSRLLDSSDIGHNLIILLVRLIWKICGSTFQDVKISILNIVLRSRFMEKLTLYISDIESQSSHDKRENNYFWADQENFWNNLINISKMVQEIIPTNCETIRKLLKNMIVYFPRIENAHSITIPEEIQAQVMSLLDIVEKTAHDMEVKRIVEDQGVYYEENMEPPDNFRDISIIPSVQEIIADVSPFLRQNIVDRAYDSINQYLDIQFRLLREDFVAPLRRGISTYLRNQSRSKKDWKRLENIKVYSPVSFLNVETVNECHCYRIRYDFSKKKRSFTYENSKRFMFGSLVCFTCDNFQSLIFGKIVQRDIKLLEQGLLVVGFQQEVKINYEVDYLMVESSVYFEPYYQVLGVLKRMDVLSFPMERYIIQVSTDSRPPEYLLKDEPVFYEVEETKFWPLNIPQEKRFYNLNDSQLTAFRAALTEEFCIIQGPPGTGKTFLGLKIAHTLLNNQHAWYNKTPILVICYTNHALDQFLEGIIPVTENILRVGGQSKNEKLAKYNLSNRRRYVAHQAAVHQKRHEVKDCIEQIKSINDMLNQIDSNESIIDFRHFERVVEGYRDTWFAEARQENIRKWLLEGKTRRQEPIRNIEEREPENPGEAQEDMDDLGLGNEVHNDDWIDDIFNTILGHRHTFIPLITAKQLREKVNILQRDLDLTIQQPESLETILQRERMQMEIWETETDLYYMLEQLAKHADRRNRRRPIHVDLKNPSNMRPDDRWQLYFYWVEQYAAQLRRKYEEHSVQFRRVFRVYNEMRDMEDKNLMKDHLLIGMTTTGAARLQSSLQALKCPIVIVEEAAEVLEAHIVAALTSSCKHLILIGDHLQLKPGAADYQIQTKFKLGISLFERMVNNNIHCYTLNVQHRMRPEISKLIKPHIYRNLEDHESTLQRAPILGLEKNLYFIDHQEQEESCLDESKKNIHECQFLLSLARHLILNGYEPEQITILAAYLGQFFEMVRERKKPNNWPLLQDVRIAVLDNYQEDQDPGGIKSPIKEIGFLYLQACGIEHSQLKEVRNINDTELTVRRMLDWLVEEMYRGFELQDWLLPEFTWYRILNTGARTNHKNRNKMYRLLNLSPNTVRLSTIWEESDIILLSLVRSNAENKAGFLRTQNRVCVALSRAKDGFYVIGNMSLLLKCNCENEIWDKVKAVLEEQSAIGSYLTLKCQIHPYKITQVSKSEDFDKLSEGGCNLMCEAAIACGHVCKRLCHVQDRDHQLYKCNESCTKTLCNDLSHVCKKLCYQECGPCTYKVPRNFDCGHSASIECHIDPSKYNCQQLVWTKLPCDHEADKPCSADPATFRCPCPCDTRVEPCGHTCDRLCHIRLDPDHLKYKCRKSCAKPRVGCREPDDNKHECTKFCFQECQPCDVGIKKFRSCGHMFTIACKLDVEEVECEKACKKILPCGHKCKNKCFESCGPCNVMVDKVIPECDHPIKIKCHKAPERKDCRSRECPRKLACGHKCTKPCRQPCTDTICQEIVECDLQAPCGHNLTAIKCHFKHNTNPELLLKNCNHPCNVELKCKHKCTGTCGKCMQSRIHVRCEEKCGVPLVCNHECPIPCREACKPCTRPCELKCKHSKCKKKCGEPCTPCTNPCGRKCAHVQCTRRCGQICNVPPCTERCGRDLKCGHRCVGFCGDPCPPLCRICNNEDLTEMLFGTEEEEDAIFVYLNDCKHTLEYSGLEDWLNQGDNRIQYKTCPKCKSTICTTERYSEYVKRANQDVAMAKFQSNGVPAENEKLRRELLDNLLALKLTCESNLRTESNPVEIVLHQLEIRLKPSRNQRRQPINKIELNAIKSKIQTLVYIVKCFEENDQVYSSKDPTILHLNMLLKVLLRSEDFITDQEIDDLELEVYRLHRMVQFDKIKHSERFKGASSLDVIKNLTENIQKVLSVNKRYSHFLDEAIKNNLKELMRQVDVAITISDREKMDIVRAMKLSKGHWFKCPNGHPYAIGECGGAMEVATCFCGAQIGGSNHRLLASNQLAGDMDGADRPAWPAGPY